MYAKETIVTVITPVFNLIKSGRKVSFLRCLQSVQQQTGLSIEHWVIDGASADGSVSWLKELAQTNGFHLLSEPDTGVYHAMNKGLALAKGKYITFLNSDDFWHHPLGLLTSVQQLELHHADYSFSDAKVIGAAGKQTYWKADLDNLVFGTHYCHQGMVARTATLREIGGFNLEYRVSADSDLSIRLFAAQKKAVYVPLCFTTYQLGGLSSDALACRRDHSRALYLHLAKDWEMSADDCFAIWQFRCIQELSPTECRRLAKAIPLPEARARLISRISAWKYWRRLLKGKMKMVLGLTEG